MLFKMEAPGEYKMFHASVSAPEPRDGYRFRPFPAQEIVTPLSTGRIWPVTMRDSSDAR